MNATLAALLVGSHHLDMHPELIAAVADALHCDGYEITGDLSEVVGAMLDADPVVDPATDIRGLASRVRAKLNGADVQADPVVAEAMQTAGAFDQDQTRYTARRRQPGMAVKHAVVAWKNHNNPAWRPTWFRQVAAHFGQIGFSHPSFGAPDDLYRDAADRRYQRKSRRWWGIAPKQLDFWPLAREAA